MDFKRLGYFAQVAELGSLSKTANRIGIAQPSLSRQMRLLEEELGMALFTREARGMMLTPGSVSSAAQRYGLEQICRTGEALGAEGFSRTSIGD